jgi:8-oxo-dGTP diphosphatase
MTKKETANLKFAILAVDVALFTIKNNQLMVRVAPVNRPPHFINCQGLPGGLLKPTETAEIAAMRLVHDKGCINSEVYLEQLYTFSSLDRDPRGRVVAVGYLGLVPYERLTDNDLINQDGARFVTIGEATKLAYDHDEMLGVALKRLASRVRYTTIIQHALPAEFTLSELENAYESILKTDLDKRNFRKKILKQNVVTATGKKKATGAHRPAELYKFAKKGVVEVAMI